MFDTVCLIGNGVLSKNCAKLLSDKHDDIRFFDANEESSWYLKKQCDGLENVRYFWYGKKELFSEIAAIQGRVLIISAVNPYIIPRDIVDSERFRAINLHHSLLPLHPGRNAEALTIFDMDRFAGITWHLISNKVDGGDVIAQRRIELDGDITSWKLLKLANDLALTEFSGFLGDLLKDELKYVEQEPAETVDGNCTLHYSYEKPNEGILDLKWSFQKMSAFLRAMDYGHANVMGDPVINWDGEALYIKEYRMEKAVGDISMEEKTGEEIRIVKDGMELRLITAES